MKAVKWALSVIVIAIVALSIYFWPGNLYFSQHFCKVAEDDCIRSWLSALGSYVTLLIAAPSLYVLWKQVRDADRNQRVAFRVSMRRTSALAKRTIALAEELDKVASICISQWDIKVENYMHQMEPLATYRDNTAYLMELLSHPDFQRFEDEIDVPASTTLRQLQKTLRSNLKQVEGRPADKELEPPHEYNLAASNMLYASREAKKYAAECTKIAAEHLEEAEKAIRG